MLVACSVGWLRMMVFKAAGFSWTAQGWRRRPARPAGNRRPVSYERQTAARPRELRVGFAGGAASGPKLGALSVRQAAIVGAIVLQAAAANAQLCSRRRRRRRRRVPSVDHDRSAGCSAPAAGRSSRPQPQPQQSGEARAKLAICKTNDLARDATLAA